jgi:hypothetical protein
VVGGDASGHGDAPKGKEACMGALLTGDGYSSRPLWRGPGDAGFAAAGRVPPRRATEPELTRRAEPREAAPAPPASMGLASRSRRPRDGHCRLSRHSI